MSVRVHCILSGALRDIPAQARQLQNRYGDFVTDWVLGSETLPVAILAQIADKIRAG